MNTRRQGLFGEKAQGFFSSPLNLGDLFEKFFVFRREREKNFGPTWQYPRDGTQETVSSKFM